MSLCGEVSSLRRTAATASDSMTSRTGFEGSGASSPSVSFSLLRSRANCSRAASASSTPPAKITTRPSKQGWTARRSALSAAGSTRRGSWGASSSRARPHEPSGVSAGGVVSATNAVACGRETGSGKWRGHGRRRAWRQMSIEIHDLSAAFAPKPVGRRSVRERLMDEVRRCCTVVD